MNTKRNKIAGAIYGFAIGDAMGATTEFLTKEQIKKEFGQVENIIGGGWLNLKPGEVTDDTQMMCCIMDALMKPRVLSNFYEYLKRNFIEWMHSNPKDIGRQCLYGIQYLEKFDMFPEITENAGNGSLMRALPLALLNRKDLNNLQGIMTHNNYLCRIHIELYSLLIQEVLNFEGRLDNYQKHKIFESITTGELMEPTGYIVNTFNNVVEHIMRNGSFEETIKDAVNNGGDADTIAAIVGSIAGALYGFDEIPQEWIKQLKAGCDKRILKILDDFINFLC